MRKKIFLIYVCFFLVLTGIWQLTVHHPLHKKWLNQPLAFSYESGNLCPLNRIMIGMFSYLQYKTMEQWSVYFGPVTLYKGPI